MWLGLAAALISICFIVLVAYLVPLFILLRKTAKTVEDLTETLQRQITPILGDVKAITRQFVEIAGEVHESSHKALKLLDAVGELGEGVGRAQVYLREKSTKLVEGVAGWFSRAGHNTATLFGHRPAAPRASRMGE